MANEGYHEPIEELSDDTRDMHRAITSLMEELEAVDWYNQRIDACKDEDLAAVVKRTAREFGKIDFLLHSIAFADREDLKRDTIHTSRAGFLMAMEISSGKKKDTCRSRTRPSRSRRLSRCRRETPCRWCYRAGISRPARPRGAGTPPWDRCRPP